MTTGIGCSPTVAARINRLFGTFHARDVPEQPDSDVAAGVSGILGRTVEERDIAALRSGSDIDRDPELLKAVAKYFNISAAYLGAWGPAAAQLDRELQTLAAIRESGVKSLAMRGDQLPHAGPDVIEILKRFPPEAGRRVPQIV